MIINKYKFNILFAFICLVVCLLSSCKDPITGSINNQPPETFIFLHPDSIISPGTSLRKISWYGDDPDGLIAGFRISFDSVNWGFTTKNDSTFFLNLTGSDSTFKLYVAAVDNQNLIDPTPASSLFPTVNSPPSMTFDAGTEIPDTTFTVASFKWTGSDPDGNSTIRFYYYSLNDTLNFRRIPASTTTMTLTKDSGLVVNSENVLYMKAQDNAGAFSPVIKTPGAGRHWYVRAVTARILLIKDTPPSEASAANDFYIQAFDTIKYNNLDIKINNGSNIPKIVNPMLIETFKLFKAVLWTANRGNVSSDNANFDLAQRTLPYYLLSGGKVFFTTGFPNTESSSNQGEVIHFAPVDSVTSCTIAFVNSNYNLTPIDNSYPVLTSGSLITRVRGLKVPSNVPIVYRLGINTQCQDSTIVTIKDTFLNPKIIFMSMPLYQLNGNMDNAKALIRKVFIQEFGIYQ